MNPVTYHHYGASVIHAPLNQLQRDMHAALAVAPDALRATEHTAVALQATAEHPSGAHMFTYRSTIDAPKRMEYSATCSLRPVVDAPHTTLVEWMREYRPAVTTDEDQIRAFVSVLIDQDQAIASRFATEYGSTEVIYIDYTLGGA